MNARLPSLAEATLFKLMAGSNRLRHGSGRRIARRTSALGVAGLLVLLLIPACVPEWSPRTEDDRSGRSRRVTDSLVGTWTKTSSAACAEVYPDQIEFFEATYLGTKGPDQRFIWWDAGGYQVTAPDRVTIGVATDEQVEYEFSLSGNVLTFRDREGCEFTYRRTG